MNGVHGRQTLLGVAVDATWQEFWLGALSDPTADTVRSGTYVSVMGASTQTVGSTTEPTVTQGLSTVVAMWAAGTGWSTAR